MKEFVAMTGLPESKIRFYEKQGLLLSRRLENGYRVFTPEDAFRSNAFRVLLHYGFSICDAVAMLNAKQGTQEFGQSLMKQKAALLHEADLIQYRVKRLDKALDLINPEPSLEFELIDATDYLYINASYGRDFSVSLRNESTIAEFYELLSISSCARIIKKDDLLDEGTTVDPDYIVALSEKEKHRLSVEALMQAKRICLGKCIRFGRRVTRLESVQKKAFDALFEYLTDHGYEIRSDIIVLPSFLNLDGQGSDVEILYVPIK